MEFLQTLNDQLVELLGPLGPIFAVAALGIVLIALALPTMMKKRADPLAKLKANAGTGGAATKGKKATLRQGGAAAKLDKFAGFLEPKNEEEMSTAKLKMVRAGYRGRNAVRTFHAIQFILGIAFLVIGLLVAVFLLATSDEEPNYLMLGLFAIIPGFLGYFFPRYWIEKRIESRQNQIQDGFPDSLDMLLVCVEAGQSLDQAIIRVAKEMEAGFPALAEEFDVVAGEIKAGKEKSTVLRAFGERSGVSDVSSFVTVMIQSQTFGTSIAEALRVYASEMRDKRVMRAEEKANKLPTKMTLGTMMFTVPPLLVILVGPSVYDMMQVFTNGVQF